jgi:hypothetical protein
MESWAEQAVEKLSRLEQYKDSVKFEFPAV